MAATARHLSTPAGVLESQARPVPASKRLPAMPLRAIAVGVVSIVAAGALAAGVGLTMQTISSQARSIDGLRARVHNLQARVDAQPDWSAIARKVEPSVFTIETSYGLGSGWVARSSKSGSELVTNFHVIDDAWSSGEANVDVRQGDETIKGTIESVDRNDDLAIIHVAKVLPALQTVRDRPALAQPVMVVGSPLGLGGTVSVGVISGFRSVEGSDYVQFSAPISPGNSGGPVVDARGRVVAVASAKFVGQGVEALSLGIPVQTACTMAVECLLGSD
jgi:putative serine protease PepD